MNIPTPQLLPNLAIRKIKALERLLEITYVEDEESNGQYLKDEKK